jgi:hypothetical protein
MLLAEEILAGGRECWRNQADGFFE